MDYDLAYANADFIPNAMAYPPRWAREAEEWRAARKDHARLGLSCGAGESHALDLFLPDGAAAGLVIFVHGGYWLKFGREDWSAFAAGPVAQGWAVAMPSYTRAPAARIRDITREIAAAVTRAAAEVAGPIVLTGHSAGGHLVARMNCSDVALPEEVDARIARIVPISPLGDLRPLMRTRMNADLRLDAAEAAAESPTLCTERRGIDTRVWVGAEERPAFLDQANWLLEAWPEARLHIAPGRHHFDVIDALKDPGSALVGDLVGRD
jgi:arylformamidase